MQTLLTRHHTVADMMAVYDRYQDGILVCNRCDQILIMLMIAQSMGWIERHRSHPLNMGFQDSPSPLPPQGADPLPPLDLGFQEPAESHSLPPLQLGFNDHVVEELPPLNLGFNSPMPQSPSGVDMASRLPLDLGFSDVVMDEAFPPPPVNQERHDILPSPPPPPSIIQENLPPLNMGFQDDDATLPPPAVNQEQDDMPQLDMGFREPIMDVLQRAHDTLVRAIERLAEHDVEGDPARGLARSQILACEQMQAIYRQMAIHYRARLGLHRTLHMLRTIGPQNVSE